MTNIIRYIQGTPVVNPETGDVTYDIDNIENINGIPVDELGGGAPDCTITTIVPDNTKDPKDVVTPGVYYSTAWKNSPLTTVLGAGNGGILEVFGNPEDIGGVLQRFTSVTAQEIMVAVRQTIRTPMGSSMPPSYNKWEYLPVHAGAGYSTIKPINCLETPISQTISRKELTGSWEGPFTNNSFPTKQAGVLLSYPGVDRGDSEIKGAMQLYITVDGDIYQRVLQKALDVPWKHINPKAELPAIVDTDVVVKVPEDFPTISEALTYLMSLRPTVKVKSMVVQVNPTFVIREKFVFSKNMAHITINVGEYGVDTVEYDVTGIDGNHFITVAHGGSSPVFNGRYTAVSNEWANSISVKQGGTLNVGSAKFNNTVSTTMVQGVIRGVELTVDTGENANDYNGALLVASGGEVSLGNELTLIGGTSASLKIIGGVVRVYDLVLETHNYERSTLLEMQGGAHVSCVDCSMYNYTGEPATSIAAGTYTADGYISAHRTIKLDLP